VALAGATAPLACRDRDGGPPPIDDFSDVVGVYETYYQFYCECYAELYGDMAAEECLAESDIFSDSEEACLTEIFDNDPAAFQILKCQVEAFRGLAGCAQAEGCPSPFMCSDGDSVPEDFVCDGFPDCADGSDEEQNCPPPFMCGDGQELESYYLCDGFEHCEDGSDELDCPEPFVCGDGEEIPPEYVCDAESDCLDGSDEEQMCPETCESRFISQAEGCGELSDAIQEQMSGCYGYTCLDDTEITSEQVCDGTPDCPDGEDEAGCPSMDGGVGSDSGSSSG